MFQVKIRSAIESGGSSGCDSSIIVEALSATVELAGEGCGLVGRWSKRSSLPINRLPDFFGVASSDSELIGQKPRTGEYVYRGAGTRVVMIMVSEEK